MDYPPGKCISHAMDNVTHEKGGLPVLYFGASHVNHLKSYIKQLEPNTKATRAFSNVR